MMILSAVKGALAAIYLLLNTILWCFLLYLFAFLKLIFRSKKWQDGCAGIMVRIGENWISGNSWGLELFYRIQWELQGELCHTESLSADKSYLVTVNHQSWVDIVVVQKVFNRKIPFLRFFLKDELIYVPILGLAWWALDFPFMKRYSKAFLDKHPEKRGEDLQTTRRACERFRGKSISMLNFLEGTRFSKEKQVLQKSPFVNLLKPKSGGLAFVIESMPGQFDSLLDVTLFYPYGPVSFWGLLAGRFRKVVVHVEKISVPQAFQNKSYLNDDNYREAFQTWISELWQKKDQKMEIMKRN